MRESAGSTLNTRASEAAVEQTACKFESCPPHLKRLTTQSAAARPLHHAVKEIGEAMKTCGRQLASGQWWTRCGETDMGQTMPVQCVVCEPKYGYLTTGATPKEVQVQDDIRATAMERYAAAGFAGSLQDY